MILKVNKQLFRSSDYQDLKEQALGENFTPRLFAGIPSNNSTLLLPNLGLDDS